MSANTAQDSDDPVIDYRDDKTLQALVPDAFGPYGFDSHHANLLVRGMFMHPSLKEALAKRVEYESTDRAAARFAKSLDVLNPVLSKPRPKPVAAPVLPTVQSDREAWTEEKTTALVQLHAQRVSFKDIAAQIPGKEVKACQEHFYKVVKQEKWEQLHGKWREEHTESQTNTESSDP